MLPHAPGVQMQAIPEDAVQEDSGDEEEDDPNKRISSKNFSFIHFTPQLACAYVSLKCGKTSKNRHATSFPLPMDKFLSGMSHSTS